MSPNAYDYGAVGAPLFDMVNVHFGRGAALGAPIEGRFHSGSVAASYLAICHAGLAHRAERSPRKREAGGSSPPASTKSRATHSWQNGEAASATSDTAAHPDWKFNSSQGHYSCSVSAATAHSAPFAKRPRHRSYTPRFPGSRPGASTITSRSSKAERPADNRRTAVRYRAGEPETEGDDYDDDGQNGAACRHTRSQRTWSVQA